MQIDPSELEAIVRRALDEDIGSGDVTSSSILPEGLRLEAICRAKEAGVLAGLQVAAAVFHALDAGTAFEALARDGDAVGAGQELALVRGSGRVVLSGERTALNFLQRMSGIATLTRAFVEAVAGTGTVILDTRKTAPGLRLLDKAAVRCGGGSNHRSGLYDMVLIKDNHIDAAGGIRAAVARVREGPAADLAVEVECRSLGEVDEAAALGVDRIMLDNMELDSIREAVSRVAGRVPLEISGKVKLEDVRAYAQTGVAFISVGQLTHSARALDISMKIATQG